MQDEEGPIQRPMTETEAQYEADKSRAALDVAYPTEKRRRIFMPYVSRYRGQEPDFYDAFAAGVKLEYIRSKVELLKDMREKGLGKVHLENGYAPPKAAEFKWGAVMTHALIDTLEDHTVSLSSGKGRREAVEMGKSNQMVERPSRWSLRRQK